MTDILIRLFVKDYKNVSDQNVRQRYGVFAGIIGIICNMVLFAAKLSAGIISASVSITADAFNSLSDAGSCIVTLIGFKMAGMPADKEHPFGHGRIEYVSGLIVAIIIILFAFELLKSSVLKIFHPEEITFSVISIAILVLSVAIRLWMFFFNRCIAKKISSKSIKATASDCLSDVIATTAVILGIIIYLITRINIDAYIGCVVALFILYTGIVTAKEVLNPILGEPPSDEFVSQIKDTVLSYENIIGVHDLMVHNYGPKRVIVSLHAEVPCDIDITQIHNIIDEAERELKSKFGCEAVIHMDPVATDEVTNKAKAMIGALIRLIDPNIQMHDFRLVNENSSVKLIFDIAVPHKFKLSESELIEAIKDAVKSIDASYELIINVDKV